MHYCSWKSYYSHHLLSIKIILHENTGTSSSENVSLLFVYWIIYSLKLNSFNLKVNSFNLKVSKDHAELTLLQIRVFHLAGNYEVKYNASVWIMQKACLKLDWVRSKGALGRLRSKPWKSMVFLYWGHRDVIAKNNTKKSARDREVI